MFQGFLHVQQQLQDRHTGIQRARVGWCHGYISKLFDTPNPGFIK